VAKVRRIAIVGAGLSGLATALAAARAGVQVDLFEAADRLSAPPAHIDVVPNMVRDLATLGVMDACVRKGFAYQGVAFADVDGHLQFEVRTPSLAGPAWPAAIGMRYGDLLKALLDEVQSRDVRLHWGALVERCEADSGTARLYGPRGPGWEGDLLVIAGASRIAGAELPLGARHHRLPQRWDHVLIPRPRHIDRCTWFIGPASHKVVVVPIGVAEAGLAVLRNEPAGEAPAPPSAAALRERLVQVGGVPSSLAALVRDGNVVISRSVQTGLLDGAWHRGAALRIGASAHLLPPHFGQAAAQSVEDAAVLGRLLRADLERSDLLTQFNARRSERAARVHAITTQAARWDLCPEPTTDLPALAQRLAPIVEQAA
jgi:2-polyprenyl-6-methoxyphenol hydroxylase-like FAD-dependent oxidoreductase